ncbi:MAG: putative toxin-antitoxin system toxin component, PIN family [Bacteroidetes bacterium]|nr:putative toxin-antitoxin system toxin component, PIN family [Bacteroidota bacterium]MBS1672269.1 putative toxin-antitoxin system toxin component, PIN family [Bacteroidota bacterium]
MKIVLDTNVLLMALPSKSKYHLIIEYFNNRKYQLIITTSILFEYEEILSKKTNNIIAYNIVNALVEAPNAIPTNIYFNWNLISTDFDDNKFIDAALTANADYIVTNDTHFNEAKNNRFPNVNIISANDFLTILATL